MPALIVAVCCALGLVALGDLRTHTWAALALMVVWGALAGLFHLWDLRRATVRGSPWLDVRCLSPWQVGGAALLVRLVMLASPPGLSDDLYRYLWEGWLTLHGGNPYLTAPHGDFGALDHPIRLLVNHPEVSSIYPPVVMWLFAAMAGIAVKPMMVKATMGLADAAIAAVLADTLAARGRSTAGAWLYAVLPLPVVESAGSGHMESLGVLCLALAVRAWSRGHSGLGWAALGGTVKLLPAVLVPTLFKRRPWLLLPAAGLALVASWPFRAGGLSLLRGLDTYAQHWSFNASGFALLSWILGRLLSPDAIRLVAFGLGALVTALAWVRLRDPARVALWVGGAFVLLSPTVHPWYLLWAWVPALVCGVRSWSLLVVLAPLSYAALASYDPSTSHWTEPAWPAWAEYLPFLAALATEWLWHAIRPGPWAPALSPRTRASASASASPT